MGSEEETLAGQRSLARGKGVEVLNTVDLSVLYELNQHYESVSSDLRTRRGEEISLLVATTITLKSLFRKMAAPKTLHPAATPSAVSGMILSSVVDRKASRS